jgi:hypothetical protein
LKEYAKVFVWSYTKMLDLDPNIILHKLPSIQGCKLMKQKLRRMRPNILIKIKKKGSEAV